MTEILFRIIHHDHEELAIGNVTKVEPFGGSDLVIINNVRVFGKNGWRKRARERFGTGIVIEDAVGIL